MYLYEHEILKTHLSNKQFLEVTEELQYLKKLWNIRTIDDAVLVNTELALLSVT
jgi:CMP-2-keto-3-deoxyoctulosonic acid synthetase